MPAHRLHKHCTYGNCGNPHKGRGFCNKHYARFFRYGDPGIVKKRQDNDPIEYKLVKNVTVDKSGCWIWLGTINSQGYPSVWSNGPKAAHREMYCLIRGDIPDGMVLDHLCRVRHCVNPKHLEPVTNKENILRGNSFSAKNAKKTHCKRGHEYTKDNTKTVTKTITYRLCKACCCEDRKYVPET